MFNGVGIIGGLVSWFLNGGLTTIENGLIEAEKQKLAAQNDADRIAADVRIQSLNAQRDVLIAESGHRWTINGIIRGALSMPAVFYLWQIILIDKVVCKWLGVACATDDLSTNGWTYIWIVVGFYFVQTVVSAAKQ